MKKFAALLLLLAATLSCTDAPDYPPGTLVIGVAGGPRALDPRYATDAVSSQVCELIYGGLFRRDKDLELVPHFAERMERPDDTTYLITLKKGITFHNGDPLTAYDVLYTYASVLDPANGSPKKGALEKIKSMRVPHPSTIIIKLKEPYAPFAGNLTLGIVPEGTQEAGDHPVGAGPFRFADYQRGSKLHLAAFADYYEGPPHISGVVFSILPDETVRLLELKKGNVHMVGNPITPAVLPWLKEQKNIRLQKAPGTNVSYIGFNLRDDILKHRPVREAIARAIDRRAIAEHLMKGLVEPTATLLAPRNRYRNDRLPVTDHNPALAEKLLDEAGYPRPEDGGPRFTLTYKTSKDPTRKKIAEIFAEQLAAVGIKLAIKSFEWGTFFGDIKSGNFQLYSLTWVGIADPDIYHYIFHSDSLPPDGANRGRYINPELDGLLNEGRRLQNFEERKKVYDRVQRIVHDDRPYVHLWVSTNVAALSNRVKGFTIYPDESLISLKDVRLEGSE